MAPKIFSRKIEKRERLLLMMAGAVALIMLYFFLRDPWQAYQQSHFQVTQAQQRLNLVYEMQRRVDEARRQNEQMLTQLQNVRNVDLWVYLSGVVEEEGLRERAEVNSKPAAIRTGDNLSAVQMRMRGISTEELVDVLHRIHGGDYPVALQHLEYVKPAMDGKGLDCSMTLIAPKL